MLKSNFLWIVFFAVTALGQQVKQFRTFSQAEFHSYKINENIYESWADDYQENDTISYHINPENYKGIVNYGVKFSASDKKVVNYTQDYFIYFVHVDIEKCTISLKDSIAVIEGTISGGWNTYETKGAKDNQKITIGEKRDTLVNMRFYPKLFLPQVDIIEYKNRIRRDEFVLDTLPALYFKNITYSKNIGSRKNFSLKCKVNEKSVLVFSKMLCYSEIYDIGKLFFSKQRKLVGKNPKREKDAPRFVKIIEQNEQVKGRLPKKTDANYYQLTEKAEGFILSRQYAKAKESYLQVANEYPYLFARDLHNAVRCSVLSRDFKTAQFWAEKLAYKGIGIKYFDAKIFKGLIANPTWNNFSKRYDSISSKTQSEFNHNLKEQLELLTDEDQADYDLADRKESIELYNTTERVSVKLMHLLEKEGFPSEEKIGVAIKYDTILSFTPRFNVLIRHAIQQKPPTIQTLNEFLDKSYETLEYDKKRISNNVMAENSCFHIYKGNLYNSKTCSVSDAMVRKMIFRFNNPNNFLLDYGYFVVSEYNKESPQEYDNYYEQNFNFVVKLTDDWEFYEK